MKRFLIEAGAVLALVVAFLVVTKPAKAGEVEAIAADAATTAAALSSGAVEMNPLGWATIPLRLAIVQHAKNLPPEEAKPLTDAVSATSWGAAVNNVAVLAGAGTASLGIGAFVGLVLWMNGADEREFLEACARHKRVFPQDAALPCVDTRQKEPA